jgi:hypothetical protein
MSPRDLIDDLRARINPAYATQLGTESYERRLCAEALDALLAEIDRLRTGDTCARYCEGAAYRIDARRQKHRSDALTSTIIALQDVVTYDGETKADFIARVRAILRVNAEMMDASRLHGEASISIDGLDTGDNKSGT